MNNNVANQLERKARAHKPAKQVRLKLVYVDFWSAVKFSFVLTVTMAIVGMVATVLIYTLLLQMGVLGKISDLIGDASGADMNLLNIIGFPQVFGFAVLCGLINVVIGTALGAVAAVVYNMVARLVGGFQLGFSNN